MTKKSAIEKLTLSYYKKMFEHGMLTGNDELRFITFSKLKRITMYMTDNGLDTGNPHYRFTFLEQNPNKQSAYGKRAANGAKIMWVIVKNYANHKERWLGRVENGKWFPKYK